MGVAAEDAADGVGALARALGVSAGQALTEGSVAQARSREALAVPGSAIG